MNTQTVSVVIPVKNGAHIITRCIADILASEYKPLEIIAVDDHSSDETCSAASSAGAAVISLSDTRGVSAARNTGANAASGDIIIFTDADVSFMPGTIGAIVDCLSGNDCSGVVGLFTEIPSFGNFCSDFKNLWMRYTYNRMPDEMALFFTSIAALKREAFLASGGFDENYREPSVEDTAFGRRLATLGIKIKLCRAALVVHHKRYTLKSLINTNFDRASALTRLWLREKLTGASGTSARTNSAGKRKFSVPMLYPLGAFALCASAATLICGIFIAALDSTMRWFTDLYFAIISFDHIIMHFLEPPIRFSIDDISVSAAVSAALLVFALLSNSGFLFHVAEKRGLLFAARASLFWFLDCFVITAGAFNGIAGFIFGRRY